MLHRLMQEIPDCVDSLLYGFLQKFQSRICHKSHPFHHSLRTIIAQTIPLFVESYNESVLSPGSHPASHIAKRIRTSMTGPRNRGWIVVAKEAARVISGRIEPRDHCLFLVQHLHVLIDLQPA